MTNEKSTAKTKDEMRWAMVRPQLEAVVRLCVALSLRWRLGEALLVRSGWVLRAGVYEDEVLRYVLEHCTDMALAEVRALLQGWRIYLL